MLAAIITQRSRRDYTSDFQNDNVFVSPAAAGNRACQLTEFWPTPPGGHALSQVLPAAVPVWLPQRAEPISF